MWAWVGKKQAAEPAVPVEERMRRKYLAFRNLLTLNNECLELMAALQEDLQFAPPKRDILDAPIAAIFEKVEGVVGELGRLTGVRQTTLESLLPAQRHEIERYAATLQEVERPRLSAWLHEVGADAAGEVGSKAAVLGELRNRLGAPVPDGYVLTTEAYRQFCGIPLWTEFRDTLKDLDPNDLEAVARASARLTELILAQPVPRAIEVAITERAKALLRNAQGLAVRSSALGEGGARTYAGQFMSLLNVPPDQLLDAYRRVVAGRFSERALFYRRSIGLLEIESPMAVLFLPVLDAQASGIMYTRDPNDAKSSTLWVTATRGLGTEIASGRIPADLFVVSRGRPHEVVERNVVHKQELVSLEIGGGLVHRTMPEGSNDEPSVSVEQINRLADWGVRIEDHFKSPQDIEWVLDQRGDLWIVQSRPLALGESARAATKARTKEEPRLSGGRTVFPGRVAGQAFLLDHFENLRKVPPGAIVFIRRPAPEIVEIFPRIVGLVAEWGNVTGHAAALLRESRVPAVFEMSGAFETLQSGEMVSLDATQAMVYGGALWPRRRASHLPINLRARDKTDPVSKRLLALTLLDPSADNFRPSGCKSTHDVLRYCHEKAIEAMFDVSDIAVDKGLGSTRKLSTTLPLNIVVLDLGGGLAAGDPKSRQVRPEEILSRPFRSLWAGMTHPKVSWTREQPASLSDFASVLASSLRPQGDAFRPLGETSYLLVANEYMNLNSRLAYHFSLVDCCVSELPSENYISFRFVGGGTSRERRNLRACFIERCLSHFGYQVDRRGDLVNAWFRKTPAEQMEEKLDILGRLLACISQLDMFMTSHEVMRWYVKQFLEGNYAFNTPEGERESGA